MDFDKFLEMFQEEIDIYLAESGADREYDFDSDREYEERYFEYLENLERKRPNVRPNNEKRESTQIASTP
ncbi:MAG: hypothetical protein D3906_02615 [Candidatus Electrothrix sp. AUS1_2]|nr:hypothetical protein [Candidatus Electrothrix sp. AUS1_2]